MFSLISKILHKSKVIYLLLCPSKGCGSIVMSMSVCAYVCLSVRENISGTTRAIFTKFLVHVALWPWLGPPTASLRYGMYFRFCG